LNGCNCGSLCESKLAQPARFDACIRMGGRHSFSYGIASFAG